MIKWLFSLGKSKEAYPIEILAPVGYNWDTVFLQMENSNEYYPHYGKITQNKYLYFKEIKYSGRTISLNGSDSYECLEDGKIRWIDKSILSFPKSK